MKIRLMALGLALTVSMISCAPFSSGTGPKLSDGDLLPDLQMLNLKGERTSLSSLKGKVVFLNFWATWCGPCVKEMPDRVKAQEKYRAQGLVILGLNVDERKDKIDAFLQTQTLNFDVWREDEVQQTTPLRPLLTQWQGQSLGYSIPFSIALDRDGRVKATILGYDTSGTALEKAIQSALANAP
jgi:thiol-disulfide isomerase/thioredoxin